MKDIINRTFTMNTVKGEGKKEPIFRMGTEVIPVADYRMCVAYTRNGRACGYYIGLTNTGRLMETSDGSFGPYPTKDSEEYAYSRTVDMLMKLNPAVVEKVMGHVFKTNPFFCYYTCSGNLEMSIRDRGASKLGMWLGDYLIKKAFEPFVGEAFKPNVKGKTVRQVIEDAADLVFEARVIFRKERQMRHDFKHREESLEFGFSDALADLKEELRLRMSEKGSWSHTFNTLREYNDFFKYMDYNFYLPYELSVVREIMFNTEAEFPSDPEEFLTMVEQIGLLETIKFYKWDVVFQRAGWHVRYLKWFILDYLGRVKDYNLTRYMQIVGK